MAINNEQDAVACSKGDGSEFYGFNGMGNNWEEWDATKKFCKLSGDVHDGECEWTGDDYVLM